MNIKKQKGETGWAFALINGRLAEIYFETSKEKSSVINGHCYVKRGEYKTKKEQGWIDADTKKYRFAYINKHYRRPITTKSTNKSL